MNHWLIFLTGLSSGGASCAALQGGMLAGFIANQKAQHTSFKSLPGIAAFLAAKLAAYTLAGFFLGLVGTAFQLNLTVVLICQALAALYVIASALNLLDIHPIFRSIVFQPPKAIGKWLRRTAHGKSWFGAAFLGLLTVFIPCGVTQAMQVNAIASGNPLSGSFIMFFFTLGTMPMFVVIGLLTGTLTDTWQQRLRVAAAALLIYLGLNSLNGVLTVINSPFSIQGFKDTLAIFNRYERGVVSGVSTTIVFPEIVNGQQKVQIDITPQGYHPSHLMVKKDVPVELTLTTKNNFTCANYFVLNAFGISARLQPSEAQVIRFIPDKSGRFTFSCSSGMYTGVMEVL